MDMQKEIEKNCAEVGNLRAIKARLNDALERSEKQLEEAKKDLPGGTSAGQEWYQQFEISSVSEKIEFIKKMLGE